MTVRVYQDPPAGGDIPLPDDLSYLDPEAIEASFIAAMMLFGMSEADAQDAYDNGVAPNLTEMLSSDSINNLFTNTDILIALLLPGLAMLGVNISSVGASFEEINNTLATKADLVGGVLSTDQLPSVAITDTYPVASEAEMLDLTAQRGDVAVRSDIKRNFILRGDDPSLLSDWTMLELPTDAVLSVNGQAGVVVLNAAAVGADSEGSAAAAQAAAIAFAIQRANHTGTQAISTVSGLQNALDNKAPLAKRVQAVSGNSTPMTGLTAANLDRVNITGLNADFDMSSGLITTGLTEGHALLVRLTDNGTPRAITWGASWRALGATLPTITVANKTTTVGGFWNTTTSTFDVVAVATEA
jgi:hypothetical protein